MMIYLIFCFSYNAYAYMKYIKQFTTNEYNKLRNINLLLLLLVLIF